MKKKKHQVNNILLILDGFKYAFALDSNTKKFISI